MEPDKTILSELQSLAPTLANLPKQEGYTTPDGYWAQLENFVLAEVDIEATELPSVVKGKVPDGYFDSLNSKIFAEIDAEESAPKVENSDGKIFSLAHKFKPLMGIAASLLIVTLVVFQLVPRGLSSNSEQASLEDFMISSEVFDVTEIAMFEGDIEGLILEDGAVESIIEEVDSADEIDTILDELFEEEEFSDLFS